MLKSSSHWKDEKSIRRSLAYGVFLLCAFAAWAGGGVPPSWQWPLLIFTFLLCGSVFLFPPAALEKIRVRVRQDPVFYFGTLFLFLLIAQWINGGYTVSVDTSGAAVMERIPSKWVPWSVDRRVAFEMLNWFFPVFFVLLVVRNVLSRADIKVLVHLLVWNSAVLACVGILQYMLSLDEVLGIWNPGRSDFFATFAYPNHAATWFYLHAALAAGLAHDAQVKRKPRVRFVIWSICFLCGTVATFLTVSRFGALVAFVQMLVVVAILVRWARSCLRGTKALNAYLALSSFALIGVTLFFGAGDGGLAREVGGKGFRSISNDLAGRSEHIACAWSMVRDYPLFGTGGWGCDGLAGRYMPVEELKSWMVCGRANVHCDPIQFLAEFGVVGCTCLAAIMFTLVGGMASSKRGVLLYWGAGGLFAVFIHSFIDLPFRCPSILLAWCCMLCSFSRLAHKRSPAEHGKC